MNLQDIRSILTHLTQLVYEGIANLDARLKAVEEKKLPIDPRIADLEALVAKQALEISNVRADVNKLDSRTFGSVRMGGPQCLR